METGTAIKLPRDKKDRDSIFLRVGCQEGEVLSSVIKVLDWGNNRRIKDGGFRVSYSHNTKILDHPDYDAISKLKLNKIKDPRFQFKEGRTYISPNHGRNIAVVVAI